MKKAQPIWYVILGSVIAVSLMFIIGSGPAANPVGRYQISTCLNRDWVWVYVIDTTTGAVKFVDKKDENKPFEEIKSTR